MTEQAKQHAAEEARMLDPAYQIAMARDHLRRLCDNVAPCSARILVNIEDTENAVSALEDIIEERDQWIAELRRRDSDSDKTVEEHVEMISAREREVGVLERWLAGVLQLTQEKIHESVEVALR